VLKNFIGVLLLLFFANGVFAQTTNNSKQSAQNPQKLVERALKKIGGIESLEKAGGIVWTGEGESDLAVRMQGISSDKSDIMPLEEKFGYIYKSGKIAYETHAKVNPDADEWMRFIHDGEGRLQVLNKLEKWAIWDMSPGANEQGRRYARIVPHLLLSEALKNKNSFEYKGETKFQNKTFQAVSFKSTDGENLTLLFDKKKGGDFAGIEYLIDYPLWGDTFVRWIFSDYEKVENLGLYPMRYQIFLDDKVLKKVRLKNVSTDTAKAEVFADPKNITIPPPPEVKASEQATNQPMERPLPRVSQLAENVHLVINVRGGFHVLAIEFKDFVTVVDAPAGFHEFQQIPAIDWAGEKNSRSVGDRLLKTIEKTIPNKPVRYVVLTHHHSDHAGGIRPFIEAGAKIIASPETASVIRNSFGRKFSVESPENPVFPKTDKFEIINKEFTISDGEMEAKIINVGKNPHVEGMLLVYLPKQKFLYQADLFEPKGMKNFPNPARVPVMKWFVEWLDKSGLKPETIYAIHGAAKVSDEQIAKIRSLLTNKAD
jgi:glyoxylase-like metal-dependent hydrolase (beta-lactamase superfamily II)